MPTTTSANRDLANLLASFIDPDKLANISSPADTLHDATSSAYNLSARARADKYIFHFPLLASNTISQDVLFGLKRNIQVERAYELLLVLENGLVNLDSVDPDNPFDSLHTNIRLESVSYGALLEADKELSESPDDMFDMNSLNEATLPASFQQLMETKRRRRKDQRRMAHAPEGTTLADLKAQDDTAMRTSDQINTSTNNTIQALAAKKKFVPIRDRAKKINDFRDAKKSLAANKPTNRINVRSNNDDDEQKAYLRMNNAKIEQHVNSTIPLLISATIEYRTAESRDIVRVPVRFGVKVVYHAMNSKDLVYFLGNTADRSSFLTNLGRLTAGELGLFSDFIFDTNGAKRSAMFHNTSTGRKLTNLNTIFNVDRLRKLRNVSTKYSDNKSHRMIPNASLAITKDEVEQIRLNTGVDLLTQNRAVQKIVDEYYLVGFYVVDEDNDLLYEYNYKQRIYEKYILSDLVNLMNREANENRIKRNKATDSTSLADLLLKR